MQVFTAVVLFFGVFVFLGNPGKILAGPGYSGRGYENRIGDHEEYNTCHDCSQATCTDVPGATIIPCPPMCLPGYNCEHGYVREYEFGHCILRSNCP